MHDVCVQCYLVWLHCLVYVPQADQRSVAMNQIELDLHRTLPTHKYYRSDGDWVRDL